LQTSIAQHFAHEAGRPFVLSNSLLAIDVERIFGAGHGDVEETAFFLIIKSFVISRHGRVRITQLSGKLDQRLPVTGWK